MADAEDAQLLPEAQEAALPSFIDALGHLTRQIT